MSFEDVIISAPIWLTIALVIIVTGVYFDPALVTQFTDVLTYQVLKFLIDTSPFWLPFILGVAFWKQWVRYTHAAFLARTKWILLEIKLPQEVLKSPLAMENVLMFLHQTGSETTFIDRNWKGQVRAIWSLEIVSIEGQVKFFIYMMKRYQPLVESSLYSQYPGIEIYEAPDYTRSVHYNKHENELYVVDYKKSNLDAYPIKTYMDYGIENEQVEEESKVDPINPLLEFLGSIGKNQQAWMQIIIRSHKKQDHKPGTLFGKTDLWKDEAKAEVEKIRAEALPKGSDPLTVKFPNPTKRQQERIHALERSISKLAFDTGIRTIYFASKKESFDKNNISGLRTMLRSYSAPDLNSMKPTHWLSGFDYPWQDFMDIRKSQKKRQGLEAYKRRSFFFPPYIGHKFVMNVEEIASIFHFPGRVATTPTLNRIPSKKAEAPSNLPI